MLSDISLPLLLTLPSKIKFKEFSILIKRKKILGNSHLVTSWLEESLDPVVCVWCILWTSLERDLELIWEKMLLNDNSMESWIVLEKYTLLMDLQDYIEDLLSQ